MLGDRFIQSYRVAMWQCTPRCFACHGGASWGPWKPHRA